MNVLKILYPFTAIQTKLLTLFLMLMFVDYAGYGYYVFYLTFAYLFCHKAFRMVDGVFLLLLFWGMSYGFIYFVNTGIIGYVPVLLFMVNCPVLYLAGKYLARYNDREGMLNILYMFVCSIAFISILSVFKDISENGFYVVGMARNVPLIGINNVEGYIAATGISSRLMLLASCFACLLLPLQRSKKIFIVFTSLLAIYCGIRVQSRTMVVGLAGVLLLTILLNWHSFSRKEKKISIIGLLLIIGGVIYTLDHYAEELAILDRFQGDEFESGGGRSYRLAMVASNMWSYPFGGMGTEIPYAHNLWFDCARVVGLFPFTLLVLLTIQYIQYTFRLLRISKTNIILRGTWVILSFAMLVVFCSEPVLEGIPMVFEFFCLILGVVVGWSKGCKVILVSSQKLVHN